MAYNKIFQFEATPTILESEVGLVTKTYTMDKSKAVDVDDRKIIKAGTLVEGVGIVFEDVDITYDEKRPVALVVAGRVIESRLATTVTEEQKATLPSITFVTVTDPEF